MNDESLRAPKPAPRAEVEAPGSGPSNPLLSEDYRIPFHRIAAGHVEPGILEVLHRGQQEIDALATQTGPRTWDNTIEPLDRITQWVADRIKPASHLMAVRETPAFRAAYNAVLPEISAFWTRLSLNEALWRQIRDFADSPEGRNLEGIRARHLEKTLLEFHRAGADLPAELRERFETVKVELARLEQKFSENVLDATAEYELLITDEERLRGMPASALERAREEAEEKGLDGWLFTLDFPSVEPVLKYADDRELRREIHLAFTDRCREGRYDNRALIVEILRMRHEMARLLGYRDFTDYRLEDHMVKSGVRAVEFEAEMAERTRPHWQRDVERLRAHAAELGLDGLRPWDVTWVSEKLRLKAYDIDDEMLRPYFPLDRVMEGLFGMAAQAFGLHVEEEKIEEVWNRAVRYYRLTDDRGTWLGSFYTDWFPRKDKRQGAWMNDFITGGPTPDGRFDPHLGVICGNFSPPGRKEPSLLTHREVETVFHEFGHLLHHCVSRVPIRPRSGLNVPWDFVELPSQIMENWTWEREALDLFARHHEGGETLPQDLFERMVRARRFMGGWQQMRQISFGSLDLALHRELAPELAAGEDAPAPTEADAEAVMAFARERLEPFSPDPEYAEHHVLTSFTHLFSGGYASGYYSYLWSEVLDADAFTRFLQEGIFNRETGRAYVETILARGDSEDPEALFREFMGRDPDPRALLERNLGGGDAEEVSAV